ncbi:MAG: hypothetical protein IBX70_01565 [Clostridia bacterium]|nr:hypothetical protein [Clostridia bacterium]
MSFVRSGPKILIIEPSDREQFKSFVKSHFVSEKVKSDAKIFEEIISEMKPSQTLLYLADYARENIINIDVRNCIIINESPQIFFMRLINSNMGSLIKYVRKSPRIVIMKVVGNMDSTVSCIAEDFNAVIEPTRTIFSLHSEGTIICFTRGNINKRLEYSDLNTSSIYTEAHFSEVIDVLDHHALKYINRNLDENKWYDLTVKIQDNYDAYKIQYDRLVYIFDQLGVGIVLKEEWGEDGMKFFASNEAYQLVLYTYMKPEEVKKILLALEYMENGERIVNYDLFYKKKKIHWNDIGIKGYTEQSDLSRHYRQILYKQLESDEINKLTEMEDYIFATR